MGDSAGKLGREVVRIRDTFAMTRRQDFMPKMMDIVGRYASKSEKI